MIIIKKRGLEEWLEDDNLMILRGIAMQCLTYEDIADSIDVKVRTLTNWRKKSPELSEAIEIGREEADAVTLAISFDDVLKRNPFAIERWWKYRLAPKFAKEIKDMPDDDNGEVNIFDNVRRTD